MNTIPSLTSESNEDEDKLDKFRWKKYANLRILEANDGILALLSGLSKNGIIYQIELSSACLS